VSVAMAEQSTNAESNFTTPADVRQIFKEELQGYFGPRGPEFSGGAVGKSSLQPGAEAGSSGWSINRELDLVTRVTRVETSLEFLAKQMIEGFERMDKRFEQIDKRFEELIHHTDTRFQDLIHQMDKRFEQVDKRFSLIQWTMGIGFTMITVLMSVYQFLG
jgi:hypothetical protein